MNGVGSELTFSMELEDGESNKKRKIEEAMGEKENEICGRFVGFAWNVGHALTFKILTDDTQKIIDRSRVRLAKVGRTISASTSSPAQFPSASTFARPTLTRSMTQIFDYRHWIYGSALLLSEGSLHISQPHSR